jgi:hypothetical protein
LKVKRGDKKGRGCPHEVEELKPMIAELLESTS